MALNRALQAKIFGRKSGIPLGGLGSEENSEDPDESASPTTEKRTWGNQRHGCVVEGNLKVAIDQNSFYDEPKNLAEELDRLRWNDVHDPFSFVNISPVHAKFPAETYVQVAGLMKAHCSRFERPSGSEVTNLSKNQAGLKRLECKLCSELVKYYAASAWCHLKKHNKIKTNNCYGIPSKFFNIVKLQESGGLEDHKDAASDSSNENLTEKVVEKRPSAKHPIIVLTDVCKNKKLVNQPSEKVDDCTEDDWLEGTADETDENIPNSSINKSSVVPRLSEDSLPVLCEVCEYYVPNLPAHKAYAHTVALECKLCDDSSKKLKLYYRSKPAKRHRKEHKLTRKGWRLSYKPYDTSATRLPTRKFQCTVCDLSYKTVSYGVICPKLCILQCCLCSIHFLYNTSSACKHAKEEHGVQNPDVMRFYKTIHVSKVPAVCPDIINAPDTKGNSSSFFVNNSSGVNRTSTFLLSNSTGTCKVNRSTVSVTNSSRTSQISSAVVLNHSPETRQSSNTVLENNTGGTSLISSTLETQNTSLSAIALTGGDCLICKYYCQDLGQHNKFAHTWAYRCRHCDRGLYYYPRLAIRHLAQKHTLRVPNWESHFKQIITDKLPYKVGCLKNKKKCNLCGKYFMNLFSHAESKHTVLQCTNCKMYLRGKWKSTHSEEHKGGSEALEFKKIPMSLVPSHITELLQSSTYKKYVRSFPRSSNENEADSKSESNETVGEVEKLGGKDDAMTDEEEKLESKHDAVTDEEEKLEGKDDAMTDEEEKLEGKDDAMTDEEEKLEGKDDAMTDEEEKLESKDDAMTDEEEKLEGKDDAMTDEEEKLEVKDDAMTDEEEKLEVKDDAMTDEEEKLEIKDDAMTYHTDEEEKREGKNDVMHDEEQTKDSGDVGHSDGEVINDYGDVSRNDDSDLDPAEPTMNIIKEQEGSDPSSLKTEGVASESVEVGELSSADEGFDLIDGVAEEELKKPATVASESGHLAAGLPVNDPVDNGNKDPIILSTSSINGRLIPQCASRVPVVPLGDNRKSFVDFCATCKHPVSKLSNHNRTYHTRARRCRQCGKLCYTQSGLQRHKSIVHRSGDWSDFDWVDVTQIAADFRFLPKQCVYCDVFAVNNFQHMNKKHRLICMLCKTNMPYHLTRCKEHLSHVHKICHPVVSSYFKVVGDSGNLLDFSFRRVSKGAETHGKATEEITHEEIVDGSEGNDSELDPLELTVNLYEGQEGLEPDEASKHTSFNVNALSSPSLYEPSPVEKSGRSISDVEAEASVGINSEPSDLSAISHDPGDLSHVPVPGPSKVDDHQSKVSERYPTCGEVESNQDGADPLCRSANKINSANSDSAVKREVPDCADYEMKPSAERAPTPDPALPEAQQPELCRVCNYTVLNMMEHSKYAHSTGYQCTTCEKLFYAENEADLHMIKTHKVENNTRWWFIVVDTSNIPLTPKFKCVECKRFVDDLQMHRRKVHLFEMQCTICGQPLQTYGIRNHLKAMHKLICDSYEAYVKKIDEVESANYMSDLRASQNCERPLCSVIKIERVLDSDEETVFGEDFETDSLASVTTSGNEREGKNNCTTEQSASIFHSGNALKGISVCANVKKELRDYNHSPPPSSSDYLCDGSGLSENDDEYFAKTQISRSKEIVRLGHQECDDLDDTLDSPLENRMDAAIQHGDEHDVPVEGPESTQSGPESGIQTYPHSGVCQTFQLGEATGKPIEPKIETVKEISEVDDNDEKHLHLCIKTENPYHLNIIKEPLEDISAVENPFHKEYPQVDEDPSVKKIVKDPLELVTNEKDGGAEPCGGVDEPIANVATGCSSGEVESVPVSSGLGVKESVEAPVESMSEVNLKKKCNLCGLYFRKIGAHKRQHCFTVRQCKLCLKPFRKMRTLHHHLKVNHHVKTSNYKYNVVSVPVSERPNSKNFGKSNERKKIRNHRQGSENSPKLVPQTDGTDFGAASSEVERKKSRNHRQGSENSPKSVTQTDGTDFGAASSEVGPDGLKGNKDKPTNKNGKGSGFCDVCECQYDHLEAHNRYYHSWAFRCKHCDRSLMYQSANAKQHLKIHNVKPGVWLQNVVRINTASIPLVKKGSTFANLKGHTLFERTFTKCKECATFLNYRSSTIREHMRTQHGIYHYPPLSDYSKVPLSEVPPHLLKCSESENEEKPAPNQPLDLTRTCRSDMDKSPSRQKAHQSPQDSTSSRAKSDQGKSPCKPEPVQKVRRKVDMAHQTQSDLNLSDTERQTLSSKVIMRCIKQRKGDSDKKDVVTKNDFCKICESPVVELSYHKRFFHTMARKCKKCTNALFYDNSAAKFHLSRSHNIKYSKNWDKHFQWVNCGKIPAEAKKLPKKCDLCGSLVVNLNQHLKNSHGGLNNIRTSAKSWHLALSAKETAPQNVKTPKKLKRKASEAFALSEENETAERSKLVKACQSEDYCNICDYSFPSLAEHTICAHTSAYSCRHCADKFFYEASAAKRHRTRCHIDLTGNWLADFCRVDTSNRPMATAKSNKRNDTRPACESVRHTRPACESVRHTRPACESVRHTRPACESVRHTRPACESVRHTRPACESVRHTRPACESVRHTRPACESVRHTRPACESVRHTRPACESVRHTRPACESVRHTRPACESVRHTRPACESVRHTRPACESVKVSEAPPTLLPPVKQKVDTSKTSPKKLQTSYRCYACPDVFYSQKKLFIHWKTAH